MSIASLERPPMRRLPAAPDGDERPPLLEEEPPFAGRAELNPWHPAFDVQLAADMDEFEDGEDLDEGIFSPRRAPVGIMPDRVPLLAQRGWPLFNLFPLNYALKFLVATAF